MVCDYNMFARCTVCASYNKCLCSVHVLKEFTFFKLFLEKTANKRVLPMSLSHLIDYKCLLLNYDSPLLAMKSIKSKEIELFEMVIYLRKPFAMKMFSSCCVN